MFEICVRKFFSASHTLDGYAGDCGRVHGHNWEVLATLKSSELSEIGLVMDFREVKKILGVIIEGLDHIHLNNHHAFSTGGLNPSTENIAKYIYREMKSQIKIPGVKLEKIMVGESRDCWSSYYE